MPRFASPHTLLARVFHWLFVVVLAYGVANPVDEVVELDDANFLAAEVLFAVAFLLLLLGRFLYMRLSRRRPPYRARGLLECLAACVHLGMYSSLAMLALSGIAVGGLYASSIKSGTVLGVLLWFHEACFWISVVLVGLHVVAAIYHRWLGDGVWSSMVPVFKERDINHRPRNARS